jgi:hypothetical protein
LRANQVSKRLLDWISGGSEPPFLFSEEDELDIHEVNRRLDQCSDEFAREAYAFGLLMLEEINRRFEYLDRKATNLAGFSGAIAAILVSGLGGWSKALSPVMISVVLTAADIALVAAGIALLATSISGAGWMSPQDWFRSEFLKTPADELKRYWISCFYLVRQTVRASCERKASILNLAECTLMVAGLMLLVALLYAGGQTALLHGFQAR